MNKKALVLIPIVTTLVIVAIIVIINQRQTPAWESRLNQYLAFLRDTGQHSYQVVSTTPATRPMNFTQGMSAESFSDSIIFQTSNYSSGSFSADLQPMPFPPEQVMCVLLNLDGQQQLVYVALHNTLYNADWVVHIAPDPWGTASLKSSLDALGCSFDS